MCLELLKNIRSGSGAEDPGNHCAGGGGGVPYLGLGLQTAGQGEHPG